MKGMIRFALIAFFPVLTQAADVPSVIINNQNSDQAMCVERATNDCINETCLNSEDRDCQAKCNSSAVDQCSTSINQ